MLGFLMSAPKMWRLSGLHDDVGVKPRRRGDDHRIKTWLCKKIRYVSIALQSVMALGSTGKT
jgi:hypothetical protein